MKKIAAIIGTGNIGTDLMIKVLRSDKLALNAFVGRRLDSPGIKKAKELGLEEYTNIEGIEWFKTSDIEIVFDCTDAKTAKENAPIFKSLDIKVIDLTPAKIGTMCVPIIPFDKKLDNINMITCGGQTSIPILAMLPKYLNLKYIEVVSQIASKSAGIATRNNIDQYIETTEKAITQFTGCNNTKVILNLNPAEPEVDMQTTMFIEYYNISDFLRGCDVEKRIAWLKMEVESIIDKIKTYVPGYELIVFSWEINSPIIISVKVKGRGDYLPNYSGNLDIINCAAIKIAESL